MRKKLVSLVYVFILSFTVIASSYMSSYDVHATGLVTSIRDKLAYYVLTVTGAVNAGVNGVSQATSSAMSAVQEKIAELWGNGIYEDASGNYVFSGQASKELLEIIMGQTNLQARVISSFPGATPYGGMYGSDSPYFHPSVKSFLNTGRSNYTDYLCIVGFSSSSSYYSTATFIDLSNCAYITTESNSSYILLTFYNSSGVAIEVDSVAMAGSYSRGDFSTGSSVVSGSSKWFYIYNGYGNGQPNTFAQNNRFFADNNISITSDYGFSAFPFYSGNASLVWSNKSIIIGMNSAYGMAEYNKASGTFVSNTYNIIPTVKKTVIENNNWQKIYNDYVTNVNNESNTYIINETLDPTALRKVMKKYTKVITDAIDEGLDDIENAISTTNEWLKKIYAELLEINDKLDNLDGGGGSGSGGGDSGGSSSDGGCLWSAEDITAVKTMLGRIDSNLATELSEMQAIYSLLQQILSAINNGCGGGGSPSSPQYVLPGTDIPRQLIKNIPTSDITKYIGFADIVLTLIQQAMPFCFIPLMGGILNELGQQPVAPDITIPLTVESVGIDQDIEIDFADLDWGDLPSIIQGMMILLFIVKLFFLNMDMVKNFEEFLS